MERRDLRLLTIEGAAYEMQVSRKYVLELIQSGALRTVLIGTDKRIPVQAILDYYREHAA